MGTNNLYNKYVVGFGYRIKTEVNGRSEYKPKRSSYEA